MRKISNMFLFLLCLIMLGCKNSQQPKPIGYFRIDLPMPQYHSLQSDRHFSLTKSLPYTFEINDIANVAPHEEGELYWIDLQYQQYNVTVHCSYKPIEKNLRELSDDAQRFVYNHAGKASAIPEQGYENNDEKVYGVMYELIGNTASPCQVYLTDSVRHFFRAAVYFNCIPNQDSLAPVRDYIIDDIRHLVETMQWIKP